MGKVRHCTGSLSGLSRMGKVMVGVNCGTLHFRSLRHP